MEQLEMEQISQSNDSVKRLKSENAKLRKQVEDLEQTIRDLMKFIGGE